MFTATKHCKRKTKEIELISVISFANNGTQTHNNWMKAYCSLLCILNVLKACTWLYRKLKNLFKIHLFVCAWRKVDFKFFFLVVFHEQLHFYAYVKVKISENFEFMFKRLQCANPEKQWIYVVFLIIDCI